MNYNFDTIIPRENTDCVQYDLRKHFFGTENVIPMWVADMDFATPPFIIEAIEKRLQHPILGYSYRSDSFYTPFINWAKKRYDWDLKQNWIDFSPGVVPALNLFVLEFTEPGDRVIAQPPVYFPFFSAIKNHGRELVENPLILKDGRYIMDYNKLEDELKKGVKLIFVSNPHNPGGMAWKKEELKELAGLCLKYNTLIVSDEIHSDLVLPGHSHYPMAKLSEEVAQQTITCMAPSKTFNLAGLATSVVIIQNNEYKKRYEEILDKIHIGGGNIFGSVALSAAFAEGEEWLAQLVNYLQGNIDFAISYLKENIPGINPMKPEATYLLWLDCKKLGMEPDKLHQFMIEKAGVGLINGAMFGTGGGGFLRMNLGCPRSKLELALENIHNAVKTL